MPLLMNMSGMYLDAEFRPEGAEVLDLTALGGTCCYCDAAAADCIRASLAGRPSGDVHWIDTGDYHYISLFWLEKAAQNGPFALVLADHHPDMQEASLGDILSCGSWVGDALRAIPQLRQVLMLGISADLAPEAAGWPLERVRVVPEGEPLDGVEDWLEPGLPVYISIDKDVLSMSYARTDWDQGSMTLPALESVVSRICAGRPVLGADICGGITASKGACGGDFALNSAVDAELGAFLKSLL